MATVLSHFATVKPAFGALLGVIVGFAAGLAWAERAATPSDVVAPSTSEPVRPEPVLVRQPPENRAKFLRGQQVGDFTALCLLEKDAEKRRRLFETLRPYLDQFSGGVADEVRAKVIGGKP